MSNSTQTAADKKAAGYEKGMSAWMCWHMIPMRDELERSNYMKRLPPDECFREFFEEEVENRAWEEEFKVIFDACMQGTQNEFRRNNLLKHFICPFPNRPADGSGHNYLIHRDGYTPRGLTLMHALIGLAYAGEVGDWVPSTSAAAFYRQYREWCRNQFPDYVPEHDEDLGREDTLGGGFYYDGTTGEAGSLR